MRWKRKFAWYPVRLGVGYLPHHNGPLIWLNFYYELEMNLSNQWKIPPGGPVYVRKEYAQTRIRNRYQKTLNRLYSLQEE